jgi:CO/xanthine dehydrogenase Mo-binding subunit
MATNVAPHGAFRGFGAPQSLFALERHMDKIAKRRRPHSRKSSAAATSSPPAAHRHRPAPHRPRRHAAPAHPRARESNYHAKRAEFDRTKSHSTIKRGIGFAAFMHGSGFTGSGERRLNSLVKIEVTSEGRPRILVSSTEFGQGTNTILSQVCAQTLRIPYEEVLVAQPDTSVVPNSGPTVASRTAMIVGKLVERASQSLCATLVASGLSRPPDYTPPTSSAPHSPILARARLPRRRGPLRGPGNIFWDDDQYKGDAYPTYAWAVYVAEVAVDTLTYSAEVKDFHALQEVGKVIHPILAKGQIEGGVAQGIGYALYEKCVYATA